MRTYQSNDEFLQALRDLMDRIEARGNVAAAHELREGFACLNGLTDGWALLMESIDRTISSNRGRIDAQDMSELENMRKAVRRIVYRR